MISTTPKLSKGITCIILSAFSFALMSTLAHAAGDIFFVQKAFFRNAVAFIISVAIILKNHQKINIPKGSMKYLWGRAIAGSLGIFGNFYALDKIPIADASILNKMSPFFAIVFSFFLISEKIKLIPFLAVVVAFLGSIFVIKPSADFLQSWPAVCGFLGGVGAGFAYACVRKLGKMQMTGSFIVAFFCAFSCLLSIPFVVTNFTPMTLQQVLLLIGAGCAAAAGQFGITYAYYFAPARDISIYDYTQIIFASSLGFLVFHQVPDFWSIIGYAVIILMAVVVFMYNRKHA